MANKILIVDDDRTNIFALAAVLRSRGLRSVPAHSAEEGLMLLKQDKDIAVVLLDMMMPDTDGYEMIGLIRQQEHLKNLPVVAVTAQAMMGDKEKCIEAGADDYVSKPIDVDRLFEMLNNYLKPA